MCFVQKLIFNMCFKLGYWVLQLLRDENGCMQFEHKTVEASYMCVKDRTLYNHFVVIGHTSCRMRERERERGEHRNRRFGKAASGWKTEMCQCLTPRQQPKKGGTPSSRATLNPSTATKKKTGTSLKRVMLNPSTTTKKKLEPP